MLGVGEDRAAKKAIPGLSWSVQNAEELSFADRSFDAYTIAFGIRNVTDIPKALREAYRVLKFGGRLFVLEFSTSDWPGFGDAYELWADKAIPRIGKAVTNDEASYRYLVESIRRFPKPHEFERMIGEAGFIRTHTEALMGGLVCIWSGWKA
jgi:demethylmenaquinone methyltransferase/2-methoxy-6-polyprenyl-1,4-benzoquinol methylase